MSDVLKQVEEALVMHQLHLKHHHVTYLGFGYDAERQEQFAAREYVMSDKTDSALTALRGLEWKAIESAPTAATGTGTLTLSETIAGLREACAGVVVSKREVLTAAEVIAAAERALETIKHLSDWVSKDSTGDLAINGVAKNALAEIAKYKEAQNA
jgi:hypothetical protein